MSALLAYEAALAGRECWMLSHEGERRRLPVARWAGELDGQDRALTAAVRNGAPGGARVLDVGCGPGRMTAALAAEGLRALGIDISATAVALARARGVEARLQDVFDDRARSGWDRVLLADGNLGIGGDPVRLLRRARELLTPGGRVVADVRRGGGVVRGSAWLEAGGDAAGAVPWAWVGVDAAARLGREAGLRLREIEPGFRRPVVVWECG